MFCSLLFEEEAPARVRGGSPIGFLFLYVILRAKTSLIVPQYLGYHVNIINGMNYMESATRYRGYTDETPKGNAK